MLRKFFSNKKGQGLVEYGLIIAGVALICAAAVSIFGHKTSDLISAVATVIPGARADDNAPITSGKLIETGATDGAGVMPNGLSLDVATIAGANSFCRSPRQQCRQSASTVAADFGGLILEP
ncbi:MAG: class III signal peptide-containing protein [Planctomycetaceae bacterium]